MSNIKLLYIDLFCGAGGTSTGVELARVNGQQCAKVIACVNHDSNAIASHAANHPEALHLTEDIRTLDLLPLMSIVRKYRSVCPDALLVLWASLECTNFSKAKGGQPRDADSRTLAEHLFRYIDALNPDYIQIENVKEFMCWGDMDNNGHPISMDRGKSYIRWVNNVCKRGYRFDRQVLNSANYGAYTSRERFFGIFAKGELPIVFPAATHCKDGRDDMFSHLKKWNPVKDVLDLQDEGESIFDRKKPLVEKTLERIYAGLIRFVAGGKKEFIDKEQSIAIERKRQRSDRVGFLSKNYSGQPYSKNSSITKPAGTITTIDHHSFITAFYGNGYNRSINLPSPTIMTKDRLAMVHFLANEYSGGGQLGSIENPNPAILTTPKQKLVTCHKRNANRKWFYLMNPQFSNSGGSIDDPCFTLIARMDKMPPYLIENKCGAVNIKIYKTDSPMTIKIKEFMLLYDIIDIKMRMLKIPELKKIMGFPKDYKLIGTQAEQKKFIGNAVEVNMARVLCEALCDKLNQLNKRVA